MKNRNNDEIFDHLSNKGILISSEEDFYEIIDFLELNDICFYWKNCVRAATNPDSAIHAIRDGYSIAIILDTNGGLTGSKERTLIEQAAPFEIWIGEASPSQTELRHVQKIVNHFGEDAVASYLKQFYPDANINCLTKEQARKIIVGITIPNAVYGVRGRDFGPSM